MAEYLYKAKHLSSFVYMKKILLDTNFLLIPGKYRVDIFSEIDRLLREPYELYIIDKTLDELERLKTKLRGKEKEALNISYQLVKGKDLKIIPIRNEDKSYVDDLILELANQDYIICTQDMELKRRLKAKHVKLITMRQKSHLELV